MLGLVVTLIVEVVLVVLVVAGLNDALAPGGKPAVTLKLTPPVNPPEGVTVTV